MDSLTDITEWTCPLCNDAQTKKVVGTVDWRAPMPGPSDYDIVKLGAGKGITRSRRLYRDLSDIVPRPP